MPAPNTISPDKLARLVGTSACPRIIDVREGRGDLIPGSVRRDAALVETWDGDLAGSAIIVCERGGEASAAVAARLRSLGRAAEVLEGGVDAWVRAGLPLVREAALPPRDARGRTVWVTRARPKVDRIACPWLIRRFVDPDAVFLFVAPGDVAGVADRMGGAPFDVEGVFWSHRGANCTFDAMVEELGLSGFAALERLAVIVRGADTGHPEIAPQAAGLLAVSLGLSRMFADDHEQLEAGLVLYDALYRWSRDAVDEVHNWESHTPKAKVRS